MGNEYCISLIGEIENPKDDAVDTFVRFANGEEYVATFVTRSWVDKITDKNRTTGEQLAGLFFWISDMIIVDNLTTGNIKLVIDEMIANRNFYSAFSATNELGWLRICRETKPQGIGEALNSPIEIDTKNSK
jgi:hypothetical protein